MKLNWGHGIAIFFSGFVAFMVFMVVKSHGVNIDLVAEDYYAREVAYQSHMDKMANTNSLEHMVKASQKGDKVYILFPKDAQPASGEILLFRPSDKQFDRTIQVDTSLGLNQSISIAGLPTGHYSLQLDWTANGKPYYYQQNIMLQ